MRAKSPPPAIAIPTESNTQSEKLLKKYRNRKLRDKIMFDVDSNCVYIDKQIPATIFCHTSMKTVTKMNRGIQATSVS